MKTLKNSSDANRQRKIFKVLLVIGIVVLISTSCLTQIQTHPSATTNTAVPSISSTPLPMTTSTLLALGMGWPGMPPIPTYIPLITPTAFVPTPTMPIAVEPPPCTFPLPQTTTVESSPENYTFSEPRVMITDENAAFDIVQWLPDSQRALIVRDVIKKGYEQYNSIELFNPRTVKVQVYGRRQPIYMMLPSWVAGLDGVIYPEVLANYSRDKTGRVIPPYPDIAHMLLSFSNGDPDKVQNIEDVQYHWSTVPHEWVLSSLAVKPDGSQIVYLKTNGKYLFQLYSREVSQGSLGIEQLIPFDTSQWAYIPVPVNLYDMAWRPNSTQILLNAYNNSYGHMYLFLLDMNTGNICQINFGKTAQESEYPEVIRWSPNGRYLAIIRGNRAFPVDFSDLDVLDTLTGNQYILAFSPDVQGRHYVADIAWAPDNYHLAAIGEVNAFEHCAPNCIEPVDRLYLVDFISERADLLFPSFQFSTGNFGNNLAWSPDGSKILATCWDGSESRLCLVPVQKTDQP